MENNSREKIMLGRFKIVKKKNTLLWMVLIICIIYLTLMIITKTVRIDSNRSTTNLIKYFKFHRGQDDPVSQVQLAIIDQSFNGNENMLEKRAQYVKQVCKEVENRTEIPRPVLSNLVVDKEHHVSWCPIYKAASSTWMKNFAVLSGVLTEITSKLVNDNLIQLSDIVRQIFSKVKNENEKIKEISETTKFIIVRHPFERLLSAYRDKLENIDNREYYYKKYGSHIVLKYRKNETIRNRTRLTPFFHEFLEFVVHDRYFDEHWVPYYRHCEPCLINYDYILKFEHLSEEQRCFLEVTDLQQYLDPLDNNFRNTNPNGATTNEIAKQYYGTISTDLLKKVYELYEKDFLLFSYVPDEYYLMSKDFKNQT